ncbi:MAG TPA: A/G-specific adenine glycosylase [Caldithrix abyssi]|uniref:Adenine DNA glycosylase n=1 Tax=Caldithrix abyssi TaxID=187145 RepID=A0A7V4TZT2_CALAY|nr:A/G-specific adenine glycosylase [Caldithrix abyssi]
MSLNTIKIVPFQRILLTWFRHNQRSLPWRGQTDWYPVFLSEFLLQQTRVQQALPYYEKFISAYPDITALAAADEDDILAMWTGLGYYARARNLLKAARQITGRFNGHFPHTYKEALSLPGIGPYTATAVLSIAYNQPYPVIDGNVIRVLSRIFMISEDTRLTSTRKTIEQLANQLIDKQQPGHFNEALMELGAIICTPRRPNCSSCPVYSFCRAGQSKQAESFPVRSRPPEKRKLNHFVFLIRQNGAILLARRPATGLLAGMWEFPYAATDNLDSAPAELPGLLQKTYGIKGKFRSVSPVLQHIYSHIRLRYRAVLIDDAAGKFKNKFYDKFVWKPLTEMDNLRLHTAHAKAWNWLIEQ